MPSRAGLEASARWLLQIIQNRHSAFWTRFKKETAIDLKKKKKRSRRGSRGFAETSSFLLVVYCLFWLCTQLYSSFFDHLIDWSQAKRMCRLKIPLSYGKCFISRVSFIERFFLCPRAHTSRLRGRLNLPALVQHVHYAQSSKPNKRVPRAWRSTQPKRSKCLLFRLPTL